MSRQNCPSHQTLVAYQTGELEETTAESVISHITTCGECQAELATLDAAGDPLVNCLRVPAPEDPYAREPQAARMLQEAMSLNKGNPSTGQASHIADARPPQVRKLGEYELLDKLGEGGMGAVYKARHTNLDRLVALKVLPESRLGDSRTVARFYREMKAVGAVDHPNIVRAMDAREIEGRPVLVMEYVVGTDLSVLLRRHGPLAAADACELIRQAAVGLQYAHENGLVHRDIKPSNLMLTRQGQVKILDLGLALLRADKSIGREMTSEGQMMGTADYIAPEQATDAHTVDIRADIYSLGCTLYKLLAGQAPFADTPHKKPIEVILGHMQKPFPSVRGLRPEVSEKLASVIERMTAKSPGERFATPAEVAAALVPFAAGCDLPGLMAETAEPAARQTVVEPSRVSTNEYLSSAMTGTTRSRSTPVAVAPAPLRSTDGGSGRRRWWIALAAAAALPLFFGIWVIVHDKSGHEVARLQVPEGGSATVTDEQGEPVTDGKVPLELPIAPPAGKASEGSGEKPASRPAAPTTAKPSTKPVLIQLEPEPLDLQEGAPMSKMALVAQPAAIPGVRSWTIETIGHRGIFAQAVYSPNGQLLATSSSDETIRLWDAATGRFLRAIVAHDAPIVGVDWSLYGKMLVTAGRDGTIRFWAPETGLRLATLRADRELISFAWSPDRRFMAAGLAGKGLQLWDLSTRDPRQPQTRRGSWRRAEQGVSAAVFEDHPSMGVANLSWCCDNCMLICGCTQASVYTFDINTRQWQEFPVGLAGLIGPAVSPEGKLVAFSASPITLWDPETSQLVRRFPENAVANARMSWAPDGKVLAGGDWGRVVLWDPESGKEISRFSTTDDGGLSTSLAFSPDGCALAAGMQRGNVDVFERPSGRLQFMLPAHRGYWEGVSWSPDTKYLVCVLGTALPTSTPFTSEHQPAQVLNSESGTIVHQSAAMGVWSSLSWSPDPNMITLNVGRAPGIWRLAGNMELALPTSLEAANVTWAQNGKTLLAVEEYSGKAEIWNLSKSTPELIAALPNRVRKGAFSPDGKLLAVGWENELKLCDVETGGIRESLPVVPARLSLIGWSPDGKTVAAGCEDKKVYLYDVGTKGIAAACEGHNEAIISLGWQDNGKILISGSTSEVCVWEAGSGKLVRTIADDGGAISADGRLIASRGQSAIRIRQTDNGKLLRTILSLRDKQYAVISPDGHFSGSPDVEEEFVYVVQTDEGQETLTPSEFAKKYGWTNDPGRVNLTGADSGHKPDGSSILQSRTAGRRTMLRYSTLV